MVALIGLVDPGLAKLALLVFSWADDFLRNDL